MYAQQVMFGKYAIKAPFKGYQLLLRNPEIKNSKRNHIKGMSTIMDSTDNPVNSIAFRYFAIILIFPFGSMIQNVGLRKREK